MTRKQREQVVELLRCVYDEQERGIISLGLDEHYRPATIRNAYKAKNAALFDSFDAVDGGLDYDSACLEAALRVEQGEWP